MQIDTKQGSATSARPTPGTISVPTRGVIIAHLCNHENRWGAIGLAGLLLVGLFGCNQNNPQEEFNPRARAAIQQANDLATQLEYDQALEVIEPIFLQSSKMGTSSVSQEILVCIQNVDSGKKDYDKKIKQGYKLEGTKLVSPKERRTRSAERRRRDEVLREQKIEREKQQEIREQQQKQREEAKALADLEAKEAVMEAERKRIEEAAEVEKEQKRKRDVKAEALAAEGTAAYNLELIRKLEGRIEVSEAGLHSRWVPHLGDRINTLEALGEAQASATDATSELLDCEIKTMVTLTRLVERMGRGLVDLEAALRPTGLVGPIYTYTISGQREHDAAKQEEK